MILVKNVLYIISYLLTKYINLPSPQGVAARSRSRYLRFAGPPQENQLKSSRKTLVKEKRALALLRLVFLLYRVIFPFEKALNVLWVDSWPNTVKSHHKAKLRSRYDDNDDDL